MNVQFRSPIYTYIFHFFIGQDCLYCELTERKTSSCFSENFAVQWKLSWHVVCYRWQVTCKEHSSLKIFILFKLFETCQFTFPIQRIRVNLSDNWFPIAELPSLSLSFVGLPEPTWLFTYHCSIKVLCSWSSTASCLHNGPLSPKCCILRHLFGFLVFREEYRYAIGSRQRKKEQGC